MDNVPRPTSSRTTAPLRWVLASLRAIEHVQGWKRIAVILVCLLMLAVVGVLTWRAASLFNLPDVGDPFDVEAFLDAEPAADRNASTIYQGASAALKPPFLPDYQFPLDGWEMIDWETADPEVRRWVTDNRDAFAIWLLGSQRPEAQELDLATINGSTPLPYGSALNDFAQIAALEGSRRRAEGDPAGAWDVYRAGLRASRHAGMRGGLVQRGIGARMLQLLSGPVQDWMADPSVDAELLHRALDDLRAIETMTASPSEAFKVEYLILLHENQGPWAYRIWKSDLYPQTYGMPQFFPGFHQGLWFMRREPERSLRVLRIAIANQLAECDRRQDRAPLVPLPRSKYKWYDVGPTAPPAARALDGASFDNWLSSCLYAPVAFRGFSRIDALESDRQLAHSLVDQAAEALDERENGTAPPSIEAPDGPDPDRLPEGFYQNMPLPQDDD